MSQAGNTRVKMPNMEKAKDLHYLRARKAVTGRMFLESYHLNRLDDQGSEGYPSNQLKLEAMDFTEQFSMWNAEHLVLLQVTKLLKTRPVVSLKILLHWPHTKLIEVIRNVSHGFSGLWIGLNSAGVQFLVVKPACRKSESSATDDCSSNIQSHIQNPHLFWWRLPLQDTKSLLPLHPLPHALSPARIWIKPWRELSVRDDFPVIIAWVRDYALFFCKLPYLQSRTLWAHVQLIHSSSNSRSNYRVRCKFNYSTCRKQKRNLIVKFVLLRREDKKQKKMLKWPVWAEYISLPRAREKWTLFLLQKLHWIELLFFFFCFSIFSIMMSCWNLFLICMHMCNSHLISRECFGTTSLPFESDLLGWEPT